jgi:hypothetical protein
LSYTFIFHKQFCFVVSGLKIIGHGNPDHNLESPCIRVPSNRASRMFFSISGDTRCTTLSRSPCHSIGETLATQRRFMLPSRKWWLVTVNWSPSVDTSRPCWCTSGGYDTRASGDVTCRQGASHSLVNFSMNQHLLIRWNV